jgi:hypothetical protein
MHVDPMIRFDVAQQIEIPLEGNVRIVSTLEQDLDPTQCLAFVDLLTDGLEAQDVSLVVLRPPVERAELAIRNTHIGVVDVAVDDVGDCVLGVEPPPFTIGEEAQLQEARVPVQLERLGKFAGLPIHV